MGFSFVLHGTVPKDEIMGVVVGHVWYFFTDVYPPLHGGYKPLDPPAWWRRLIEGRRDEVEETVGEIEVPPGAPVLAPPLAGAEGR